MAGSDSKKMGQSAAAAWPRIHARIRATGGRALHPARQRAARRAPLPSRWSHDRKKTTVNSLRAVNTLDPGSESYIIIPLICASCEHVLRAVNTLWRSSASSRFEPLSGGGSLSSQQHAQCRGTARLRRRGGGRSHVQPRPRRVVQRMKAKSPPRDQKVYQNREGETH